MTTTHDSEGSPEPWRQHGWVELSRVLLDSFRHFVGRELMPREASALSEARNLFLLPQVVVAHGTQADPILSYANRTALELWQLDIPTLLQTPSRMTAEPVHRDERSRLLQQTARQGYVDDYQGIRISRSGRRFRIQRAIIWNLVDPQGNPAGQAATFSEWSFLDAELGTGREA